MRLVLKITSGPQAGRTWTLEPGVRRLIGRGASADLRVTSDEYVSDLHVAVEVDEKGACHAQDLCSSNGTRLNGLRIDEAVLRDGNKLKVGATEMLVVIEEEDTGEPGRVDLADLPVPLDEEEAPPLDGPTRIEISPADRFKAEAIEHFIDRMVETLRRDFARELSAWDPGEAGLRAAICEGMTRAAGYGVERQDDLERYLKLMAILGPKFDEDATLPWAGEILRRKVVGSPRKLDALKEHLAARYGRNL